MDTESSSKVFESSRRLSSFRDLRILASPEEGQPLVITKNRTKRDSKNNMVICYNVLDEVIHQNFKLEPKQKTEKDFILIRTSLTKHFVFHSLIDDEEILSYLLQSFFYCTVDEGEFIIRQGDSASSFFVLEEGSFAVIINETEKRILPAGQGFGELSLLYNAPRSASLKARERCTLWGISRGTFRKVVQRICSKHFSECQKSVENLKFFKYLKPSQKAAIADQLILQQYNDGDMVVRQDDPASSLYILKTGKIKMFRNGKLLDQIIEVGESFGQQSMKSDKELRPNTIVAEGNTTLFALSTHSIGRVFGSGFQQIIIRNKIAYHLQQSLVFSRLSQLNRQRVMDTLVLKRVLPSQVIVKSGSKCSQRMFFVIEGLLENNLLKIFHGEAAVRHPQKVYEADVTSTSGGLIALTTLPKIQQALEGTFQQVMVKQDQTQVITQCQRQAVQEWKKQTLRLDIKDLKIIKKMGQGQFGQVYLVTTDERKTYYALKCINKVQVIDLRLQKHLKQQKQALQILNHPFLIQYGRSFKDDKFIYFLTEFINGMELFDVIREIGLLECDHAKFYIGSLLLMLEYLHSESIIYRDLKPQNLMVNEDGYLKLIDMGTCRILEKAAMSKTFTILGTPHYMAPEVLTGKGYSYNADLWSLGICLFEFVCGYVPFGEEADDPYEIYEDILNKDIVYPKYITDQSAKSFVSLMLDKMPEVRLSGSFATLKAHPWFSGFNWDNLISKNLNPPYIIPAQKKVNLVQMGSKALRLLKEELRVKPDKSLKRKVVDPQWDSIF